jgi:hypothetical protein
MDASPLLAETGDFTHNPIVGEMGIYRHVRSSRDTRSKATKVYGPEV